MVKKLQQKSLSKNEMKNKRVLIVAAHPDDEVLGCGGTMAMLFSQGAVLRTLILARGIESRGADKHFNNKKINALYSACEKANKILGVTKVSFGNFPDNQMDSVPLLDVTQRIESEIQEFKPDIIYSHGGGDVNIDHFITHRAVITATRPIPGMKVKQVFFFEVNSSTEWGQMTPQMHFLPNVYSDISLSFDKKIAALECYNSEMRQWPHPRSIEGVTALARYRGSNVGVDYAEAFSLGRWLQF